MAMGKVYLVGAGPGDPGLLTVKAQQLLAAADVVVYDRLVCEDILAYASNAQKRYVGKNSGHHSLPQEEINALLVQLARQHKRIVRLKGGDPYLFGRGGEEVLFLREHGVPFEVVPGVTSALAALSYSGIPATHRDAASSVHIITGHLQKGASPTIDFEALCNTRGTLVFLMAVATMDYIVQGLLAAGMHPQTPAAVVENGTLPQQRRITAPLCRIVAQSTQAKVKSPAILAVGEVCALATELDWFSRLPLSGKAVVVTRPAGREGTLTHQLRQLGAQTISFPCIETAASNLPQVCQALKSISLYSWLVLTSAQGVESLFVALAQMNKDARHLAPVKLAVVGPGTAKALEQRGLIADYMPEHYDGVHLAQGLIPQLEAGQRLLLLRAEKGTPELAELLQNSAIPLDDVACYTTHTLSPDGQALEKALHSGQIDYVTFTSASTVEGFAASFPQADQWRFTAVCIGESSRKAAEQQGYTTITAQNATIDDLLQAITEDSSHE